MKHRIGLLLCLVFGVSASYAQDFTPVSHEPPPVANDIITHSDKVCEAPTLTEEQRKEHQVELIQIVADTFQVPAGALYGIWKNETRGLQRDWGTESYWFRAARLTWPASDCVVRYSVSRCWHQWLSFKHICTQQQHGHEVSQTLCDPLKVHTSYAMALGPMQHMPMTLLPAKGRDKYAWAVHVVDFDDDGAINPFELPDAMAMTALFIKRHHFRKYEKRGHDKAWVYAINRHYGLQNAGYYKGGRSRGVMHYWRDWCKMTGDCRSHAVYSIVAFAEAPSP